jgi:ABC-type lipoprotein release transport system permease subunit
VNDYAFVFACFMLGIMLGVVALYFWFVAYE